MRTGVLINAADKWLDDNFFSFQNESGEPYKKGKRGKQLKSQIGI